MKKKKWKENEINSPYFHRATGKILEMILLTEK